MMLYSSRRVLYDVSHRLMQPRFASSATPALVKILRERTGAPMMDCKKALDASEVAGDVNKAIDWLRAKGIAKAASISSSGRKASEGLIAQYKAMSSCHHITMLEINSETDFVARNVEFQKFVCDVAMNVSNMSNKNQDVSSSDILSSKSITHASVQEALGEVVAKIRENIVIRRAMNISAPMTSSTSTSVVGTYIHGKVDTSYPTEVQFGRAASIIELEITPALPDTTIIDAAAKKLAMHIVASKPSYRSLADIPAELITKEQAIFREQSLQPSTSQPSSSSGKAKSPEMMEKMIMGKVNKRLAEITLLEQAHVAEEGSPVISKYLDSLSKSIGEGYKVQIKRFYLWTLGQTENN